MIPYLLIQNSLFATDLTASSMILTVIKIGVSSYISNMEQVEFFSRGCFPSKTDATVLLIVSVHSSAHFLVSNFPLFPVTYKLDCFSQFSFQDEVRERSMMLLLCLNPKIFYQVSHSLIIHVFHEFIKHPMITEVESKQYALANLHGIILCFGCVVE